MKKIRFMFCSCNIFLSISGAILITILNDIVPKVLTHNHVHCSFIVKGSKNLSVITFIEI